MTLRIHPCIYIYPPRGRPFFHFMLSPALPLDTQVYSIYICVYSVRVSVQMREAASEREMGLFIKNEANFLRGERRNIRCTYTGI